MWKVLTALVLDSQQVEQTFSSSEDLIDRVGEVTFRWTSVAPSAEIFIFSSEWEAEGEPNKRKKSKALSSLAAIQFLTRMPWCITHIPRQLIANGIRGMFFFLEILFRLLFSQHHYISLLFLLSPLNLINHSGTLITGYFRTTALFTQGRIHIN